MVLQLIYQCTAPSSNCISLKPLPINAFSTLKVKNSAIYAEASLSLESDRYCLHLETIKPIESIKDRHWNILNESVANQLDPALKRNLVMPPPTPPTARL